MPVAPTMPPVQQTPQTGVNTTDTGSGNDYGSEWNNWMAKPSNRAAMMQFGVAMMQPIGIGQSAIGNIANAVGEGGEAANRVEQQDILRRRENSSEDLRASQADLAGARAGTQSALADARTTAADASMERALRTGEAAKTRGEISTLQARLKLQGLLQAENKSRRDNNTKNEYSNNFVPQPELNEEEYLRQNPLLAQSLGFGQGGGQGGEQPMAPAPAAPRFDQIRRSNGPGINMLKSALQNPATKDEALNRIYALAAKVDDWMSVYHEFGITPPARRPMK